MIKIKIIRCRLTTWALCFKYCKPFNLLLLQTGGNFHSLFVWISSYFVSYLENIQTLQSIQSATPSKQQQLSFSFFHPWGLPIIISRSFFFSLWKLFNTFSFSIDENFFSFDGQFYFHNMFPILVYFSSHVRNISFFTDNIIVFAQEM